MPAWPVCTTIKVERNAVRLTGVIGMTRSLHRDATVRALIALTVLAYLMVVLVTAIRASGSTLVTPVKVTAGKPSEYRFTLVPIAVRLSGAVRFTVRNVGSRPHQFKVCTTPRKTATLLTCVGKTTKLLKHGQSATLVVSFAKAGRFEYLSTPADAARGMRGLLTVKAALSLPVTTTPVVTTPTTTVRVTTTPATTASTPTTTAASSPSVTAGKVVWTNVGCGSCHVLASLKGAVNSSLNSTHPEPFQGGPLTQQQISDVSAYINAS